MHKVEGLGCGAGGVQEVPQDQARPGSIDHPETAELKRILVGGQGRGIIPAKDDCGVVGELPGGETIQKHAGRAVEEPLGNRVDLRPRRDGLAKGRNPDVLARRTLRGQKRLGQVVAEHTDPHGTGCERTMTPLESVLQFLGRRHRGNSLLHI